VSDRIVTTQAELDAALADGEVDWIEIRSPRGVWLEVTAYDSATVTASDSATVTAYDSATVTASDSATVRASGSATVTAYDSATVRASGSATVTASDSATVTASDSATVTASGSATVRAYGSATVRAYGSATVTASDSATVRASGSATVTAYDSATVTASDSATVRASAKTAVHLHSGYAKVSGGVLIDHTADLSNPADWCEYHGVKVSKAGVASVYKAVSDTFTTDRGFDYSPGKKPSAPDWRDDTECGGGLHFSPSPVQALAYFDGTRFVEVGVKVAELRPIPGGTAKCKAPRVVRACREVDIDGKPVAS
jgi:hypothetical protein